MNSSVLQPRVAARTLPAWAETGILHVVQRQEAAEGFIVGGLDSGEEHAASRPAANRWATAAAKS